MGSSGCLRCLGLNVLLYLYLMPLTGLAKEEVPKRGSPVMFIESLQTSCDHDIVEYFKLVPGSETLFHFKVAKIAKQFFITITVRVLKSQRYLYRINQLDGCLFLNGPIVSQVFSKAYRQLVVNHSYFKCPIRTGVYYLKNVAMEKLLPAFQPAGHYQLTVRLSMPQSKSPFVMQITLNYTVTIKK